MKAATALLLSEGLELTKHGAVIASLHQRFVKAGKLSKEQGKTLNWLFELRSVGGYGGTARVSSQQVEQAIQEAEEFKEYGSVGDDNQRGPHTKLHS